MTHTYQLTGMTCSGCENKVKNNLLILPHVTAVEVSKDNQSATISMDQHITLSEFQQALGGAESKYQIKAAGDHEPMEEARTWVATYKPILLIFGYITIIATISAWHHEELQYMTFMRVFMAGFFLTFSFFKFLNLKAFAESYAMYDVVAKKFPAWGYIYAFVEFGLGLSFALNLSPVMINWITLVVMTVSILGVLETVINKKKIQCACLGTVFNLPMSTVTIVEDAMMILMSAAMLLMV